MSEYQYYEFRAIDRPLDEDEREELGELSTRAEITSTSFTNTYNYGDFRGDPAKLMDRYFDAFVYVANWGTRRLMFRIPKQFLDPETASAYCDGEGLSMKVGKEHLVLEFWSEDEDGGEWTEGEPWMPSLVSIRDQLIRGDHRALYLGWLAWAPTLALEDEEDEEEEDGERLEPPVPPGLAKLSGPLKSLAEFLRIDDELIEVAAQRSEGEPPAEASKAEMARWVQGLPVADKDAYLLRVLAEESSHILRMEMARRFREATTPRGARPASQQRPRPVKQLIQERDSLAEKKKREAAERAAKERAIRDREKAEARARYLDDLAALEPATWREIESLIATKLPRSYDRAIELLVDLRDLAGRSGRAEEARARTEEIRQRHARKPSLMERFAKHKLG
jgi:hypothetical protein